MDLSGRQWEVFYLPTQGHSVVLGVAGSGKSMLAVRRAAYLADPGLEHGGPTLLLTFSRTLTNYFATLVPETGSNVDARTFHVAARSALEDPGRAALYNSSGMKTLEEEAIESFRSSNPGHRLSARPPRFFQEEFNWIAGQGIETGSAYSDAVRTGRGTARLLREDRNALFDIYVDYRILRAKAGYQYDLNDVYSQLHQALRSGDIGPPYQHVVIDEGQDLPPEALRAAARMIPETGSLTLFADYAQQIYGRRVSWRSAGLRVPKLWTLTENYRNTKQIAALADAIAASPGFETEEALLAGTTFRDGPQPQLIRCQSDAAELEEIDRQARELSKEGTVAVLTRTWEARGQVSAVLPPSAIKLDRNTSRFPTGIYYGTLHAAKGLEFDSVVVFQCSADHLPNPGDIEAFGEEEARAEDLGLLYVAATRARRNLILTYSGLPSSLIPTSPGLFDFHER